jgi:hypothetical protein
MVDSLSMPSKGYPATAHFLFIGFSLSERKVAMLVAFLGRQRAVKGALYTS